MNVFNTPLFNPLLTVPMNQNLTSNAVPVVNMEGYSIQAVYTASPNGILALQASSDPFKYATASPQPPVPMNWTTITNSPQTVTAAGVFIWNVEFVYYNYVRLIYTDLSGGTSTATLTAVINAKGP